MIISASRRTDIPAYYSEWLVNRLRAGFVFTRNPMNHAQVSRVRLSPEVVDCIVFWTKDPENMMDKLHSIDDMGYRYYFQFTLTPYGKAIEPGLRDKSEIIETFKKLSNRIGSHRVLWRYDPIILNKDMTVRYHRQSFEALCEELGGYTDVCTISFVDIYAKLATAVKAGIVREISEGEITELAGLLAQTGRSCGIEVRACCEKTDLSAYGIRPASCIDKETVERVCGYSIKAARDTNQRPGCGCIQSIDIGSYNTCRNGCLYCYANYSPKAVIKSLSSHDPRSEILTGRVSPADLVRERRAESLRSENTQHQTSEINSKLD